MIDPAAIKAFKELLSRPRNVVVMSPDRPDLDSVTSNVALARTLVAQGHSVRLLANEELKPSYNWVEWASLYLTREDLPLVRRDRPDLIIITDAASRSLFSELTAEDEWLFDEVPVVLVDHHATAADFPVAASVVDPDASATGSLLVEVYEAMGWEIVPELADLMLGGIIFDTNRFENSNVGPAVFAATAKLVAAGGDFYAVNQAIEASRAMDEKKFVTLSALRQRVIYQPPVAYALVPHEDVAHLGSASSIIKPLVESFRALRDIRAAFVLVQREDGSIILSMRSQPGIDVGAIAEHFGGGGHAVAAAARIKDLDLTDTAIAVLKEVMKAIERADAQSEASPAP